MEILTRYNFKIFSLKFEFIFVSCDIKNVKDIIIKHIIFKDGLSK